MPYTFFTPVFLLQNRGLKPLCFCFLFPSLERDALVCETRKHKTTEPQTGSGSSHDLEAFSSSSFFSGDKRFVDGMGQEVWGTEQSFPHELACGEDWWVESCTTTVLGSGFGQLELTVGQDYDSLREKGGRVGQ